LHLIFSYYREGVQDKFREALYRKAFRIKKY
jgi:hypothetical protein